MKGVTFRSDVVVVVVRKGTWQTRSSHRASGSLWAWIEQQGHGIMVFPACSVRRSVLPRVYACSSSLAIKQPHSQKPTPGVTLLCIMYHMYVPESSQKEGYIRGNMQNPSGWYHGDYLTKRDWEEHNNFRKEPAESRLTAGCGVSSTVARGTWQNARPERCCSMFRARRHLDL